MDIKLIPATEASAFEICACGVHAFENDDLEHAVFPSRSQNQAANNDSYNFRVERTIKRLQSPEWLYVLATTLVGGQKKLLGYAGWTSPSQEKESAHVKAEKATESGIEQQSRAVDSEVHPKGMDVEVYKHVIQALETAKKDILGDSDTKVWCKL
jgi:hypothetical protein